MKYLFFFIIFSFLTLVLNAEESDSQMQYTSIASNLSEFKTDTTVDTDSSPIDTSQNKKINFFIAYELGEAVFNKFQSLSWEMGIRIKNQKTLRLVHVNLNLTEEHLSSGFAGAVDGENVEGNQFGFEAFYDFPVFFNNFYFGPSIGYYKSEYQHTKLDESLKNSSFSVGAAISYRETNIFKVKGLYYSFSVPMRINLNPIEETNLGTTTITNSTFDNNIWLFIGYEF